jgi:ketosteroid isomerase-like protein
MSGANVKLMEKWFSFFNTNTPDIEQALSCLHPDIVLKEADSLPYPGIFQGRDGYRKFLGILAATFAVTVQNTEFLDAGTHVVGRMDLTFKSRANGRSVTMPVVEIYKIKDGLITDMDAYYKDTKAIYDLTAT